MIKLSRDVRVDKWLKDGGRRDRYIDNVTRLQVNTSDLKIYSKLIGKLEY